MAWIWITLVFALVVHLFMRALLWKKKSTKKKLPPGPRGFPILGNLHLLGQNPHHDLHKLAQKYGPIMSLRLGFVPTIVISSPEAAELFLKTHDLVFASRPPQEAMKHMSYEQRNMSFAPYGPYWRNIRKMCTLELLSTAKVNSFESMRREEVGLLVCFLKDASLSHAAVDMSAKISSLSADMSCRMIFGKKYMDEEFDERGFKAVFQEGAALAATPNVGDYVPYLAALDLQGLTRRMKAVSKVFDAFFEKIINEHLAKKKEEGQGQGKDFVDVMLGMMGSNEGEYHIERTHIKSTMLDMMAASMDTSATAIDYAMSELIRHPQGMKKLQHELKQVVGMNRTVEESDIESLEFLDMVVKETLRLHPPAPLLLPHESIEDCTVGGFHIPRKSRVIVNAWAIGRDPHVWGDPEKFVPERFEGTSIDVWGHDFQLVPFGSGRRGCPGMQLGLTVIRLVLAQLTHCFDWELPDGMSPSELDMSEEFGLTTSRVKHLVAIPSFRLKTVD
ncbi:cytochrome P450 71AU50-like [Rhodamnia argentea]|uniref:Cytochrome P450 71AU50-like n=1 Tax=Rhodamnia argentea TaxID=178133 RepID=A0A8B8PK56_9MYRT|nr:cytochrome P450 71AU50-like [Rhodamnia argentea]